MSSIFMSHPENLGFTFSAISNDADFPYLSDLLPPEERKSWSEDLQRSFDAMLNRIWSSLCGDNAVCGFSFHFEGVHWYFNAKRYAAVPYDRAVALHWTDPLD